MEKTIKDRLLEFIEHKSISVRQFELASGLGSAYIAHMPKKMSPRKISGISAAYPELNLTWLLEGRGEMLLKTPEDAIEQSKRIDAISQLRLTLAAKDEVIAAKDEIIETLRDAIALYKKRIEELERSR